MDIKPLRDYVLVYIQHIQTKRDNSNIRAEHKVNYCMYLMNIYMMLQTIHYCMILKYGVFQR